MLTILILSLFLNCPLLAELCAIEPGFIFCIPDISKNYQALLLPLFLQYLDFQSDMKKLFSLVPDETAQCGTR